MQRFFATLYQRERIKRGESGQAAKASYRDSFKQGWQSATTTKGEKMTTPDPELLDGTGAISSMRVTLRWARRWGATLIAASIATATYALVARYADAFTLAIAFATLGAGMPSAVAGAKAMQSRHEKEQ